MANYTYAHTLDDGQVLGDTGTFNGSSDATLNPYNQQVEWGNSDYDQRQRFVTSLLWSPRMQIGQPNRPRCRERIQLLGHRHDCLAASAERADEFPACHAVRAEWSTAALPEASNRMPATPPGALRIFRRTTFRGPTQIRDVDFRIGRDIHRFSASATSCSSSSRRSTCSTTASTRASTPRRTPTWRLAELTRIRQGWRRCVPPVASPCLNPATSFLTPTATSNALIGARQLQISGKFFF